MLQPEGPAFGRHVFPYPLTTWCHSPLLTTVNDAFVNVNMPVFLFTFLDLYSEVKLLDPFVTVFKILRYYHPVMYFVTKV